MEPAPTYLASDRAVKANFWPKCTTAWCICSWCRHGSRVVVTLVLSQSRDTDSSDEQISRHTGNKPSGATQQLVGRGSSFPVSPPPSPRAIQVPWEFQLLIWVQCSYSTVDESHVPVAGSTLRGLSEEGLQQ